MKIVRSLLSLVALGVLCCIFGCPPRDASPKTPLDFHPVCDHLDPDGSEC